MPLLLEGNAPFGRVNFRELMLRSSTARAVFSKVLQVGKVPTGYPHVAFMLHGAADAQWKSLINGIMLHSSREHAT